jgi:hypothetical protein
LTTDADIFLVRRAGFVERLLVRRAGFVERLLVDI